jgi:predicted transcriptional regulator of viral defense system
MARVANEIAVEANSCAQTQSRSVDRIVGDLAERQHGVVSRKQLLRLGLSPRTIGHRLKGGRLRAIHRGVYAVGHSLLSVDGRWMAAVLAGGEGAVLSHRDAGAAWGIRRSSRKLIEITVSRASRARPELQVHCARLPADEVTTLRGIPITTVPRTIFDLATFAPRREVEHAIHEAEVRRLHDPLSLHDLVARYPRHRGVAAVRAILADHHAGSTITKEELERLFIGFLERWDLPLPDTNRPLWLADRWIEPDCAWEPQRVIVELDGYAVHGARRNFESDRARDRGLQAAGWRVIRITWRQLVYEEEAVAADLRCLLGS